jgi:hypothetical protein
VQIQNFQVYSGEMDAEKCILEQASLEQKASGITVWCITTSLPDLKPNKSLYKHFVLRCMSARNQVRMTIPKERYTAACSYGLFRQTENENLGDDKQVHFQILQKKLVSNKCLHKSVLTTTYKFCIGNHLEYLDF